MSGRGVTVAHGCGCAPDDLIRWIVVGLLAASGVMIFAMRWWLRRRATARPKTTRSDGSGRRRPVERSATAVAGGVIVGLAVFVALVPMGSDPALLVLALGATIGTAGFALASPRTRQDG